MTKKSFPNPIVNELKGSAWFKRPEGTQDKPAPEADNHSAHRGDPVQQQETERSNGRTSDRPTDGANERTDERSNGAAKQSPRLTKRHSFEIYQDQWERFQKLRAQALLRGEQFNMSAIVRKAIDTALEQLERD